jgi:glycosyltransferase involved in cell wall biosynthesis
MDSFGGIQTFVTCLMEYLSVHGVEVSYAQLARLGPPGVLLRVHYRGSLRCTDQYDDPVSLVDLVERHRPDLIHSHNLHTPFATDAAEVEDLAGGRGIPHVLTVHDVTELPVVHERLRRLRSTVVATQSEFNREWLRRITGRRIARLRVAIDFGTFVPTATCEPRTIAFPGRLSPEKGALRAIDIAGELSARIGAIRLILSDRQLRSFGSTPDYLGRLSARAAAHPGLACEYNAGPPRDMYHRAALSLVLPGSIEGFGLSALESLACGRPVVMVPTGGMREWTRGLPGVFVGETADSAEVPAGIERVLGNWEEWHRGALAARARLSERFGIGRVGADHVAFYRSVLKGARA